MFYCDTMHTKSACCYYFHVMLLPEGKHCRGINSSSKYNLKGDRTRKERERIEISHYEYVFAFINIRRCWHPAELT